MCLSLEEATTQASLLVRPLWSLVGCPIAKLLTVDSMEFFWCTPYYLQLNNGTLARRYWRFALRLSTPANVHLEVSDLSPERNARS